MALFDRFRGPLPELSLGESVRETILSRLHRLEQDVGPDRVVAVWRAVVLEDLWPPSASWREALGTEEGRLEAELYLCALSGLAGAVAGQRGWDVALAALAEPMEALREYVPYGAREHFDEGPRGMLQLGNRVSELQENPDAVMGTLWVMGKWLGISKRKGAMEGWYTLGRLAWMVGEVSADLLQGREGEQ